MSSIKKHQCPSCGGSLVIDNNKQMYYCTSCGSTYDYEYFREDQMHQMGEKYLSRGEFGAAAEAYQFKLKKEPHDFLARRGLMLAAAHLKDMDDLIREDHSRGFSYDEALVSKAVEGALETDKGYFKDLEKIYSDMKDLSELYEEIDSLGQNRRNSGKAIRGNEVELNDCYIEDRYGKERSPTRTFTINWIILAVLVFITEPWLVPLVLEDHSLVSIFVALVIISFYIFIPIMNLTVVLPKIIKKKKLDKSIRELSTESDKIGERLKKLDAEAERLSTGIRTSSHDFAKKDRLIMRDKIVK